jgi:drug/metabolite transporter (DMT)-like permease
MPACSPTSPDQQRRARTALCAVIAGAVAIAFAGILVRMREEGQGLIAVGFWRLALSLPVFWAAMLVERRHRGDRVPKVRSLSDVSWMALAGLFFALDLSFWHWSLHLTKVANATLFTNFAPVIVTIVSCLWLGERIGWVFVAGLALALGGSACLLSESIEIGGPNLAGDLLGVATAFFYAGYILCVKKARFRFSTLQIMTWSGLTCTVVLLGAALLSHRVLGGTVVPRTALGWGVVAALALVCQIGGQALIAYGLAHLPAGLSSVNLLVQPVAAALYAWFLLDEALGALAIGGGVLVLCGIFLARQGSRQAQAVRPECETEEA